MKLQHLAVIFVIIFLPIILITSYYIEKQVDTIDLQLSYDDKLLDATYDALRAFEINTANEDLSTVSDSLRSIIEASNNIFFNTLATNMGISNASKSYVQPYVPAILYTLYDGYYIYSPASTPEVCVDQFGQTVSVGDFGVLLKTTTTVNGQRIGIYDFFDDDSTNRKYPRDSNNNLISTVPESGQAVDINDLDSNGIGSEYGQLLYKNKDGTYSTALHSTGNISDTSYKQSYILKSYVSYSANYVNGNINVDINYTLDNFISVTGTIGDVYYTKSGYLIDKNLVTYVEVDGNDITNSYNRYSEEEIDELIENDKTIIVRLSDGVTIDSSETGYIDSVSEDAKSSAKYYIKAWMFSNWVYDNLGVLAENDLQSSGYELVVGENSTDEFSFVKDEYDQDILTKQFSTLMHDFSGSSSTIFDRNQNPEDNESTFAEHKRKVIKNSITYNLALAMVTYTEMSSTKEYELPIMSDEEWDSILSNVSMVTFMQGIKCGLKYYNNYVIATSTNNEITVTPSEIYYVPIETVANVTYADGTSETIYSNITDNYFYETAHRIDCEDLCKGFVEENIDYYISFKAKEIKYDKIYDKSLGRYTYDHKAYLDYNCIVNNNYIAVDGETRGNTDLELALKNYGNSSRRLY